MGNVDPLGLQGTHWVYRIPGHPVGQGIDPQILRTHWVRGCRGVPGCRAHWVPGCRGAWGIFGARGGGRSDGAMVTVTMDPEKL